MADTPQRDRSANSQDTFSARSNDVSPQFSSLPRVKLPRSTASDQGGEDMVEGSSMNQDVYYSPNGRSADTIPEGVDTNIFHSPRVAALMSSGGKNDRRKAYEMRMKAAGSSPRQPAVQPDTPSTSPSTHNVQEQHVISRHDDADTRRFAQELAQDVTETQDNSAEVPIHDSHIILSY